MPTICLAGATVVGKSKPLSPQKTPILVGGGLGEAGRQFNKYS